MFVIFRGETKLEAVRVELMFGKSKHSIRRTARFALRVGSFIYQKPRASWLLIRMASWVGLLTVLSRILPLPRVLKLMQPRRRITPGLHVGDAETRDGLAQLLDMLLRTEFLCFTPTCWKRAPILQRYLALRDIESQVVFGVRKEDDNRFKGHAWLEANGEPLLEKESPNYIKTFTFPSSLL